jgi:predicted nucleic acid-binding protein
VKYFFDTNILIYAFDDTNSEKNRCAKELIEKHLRNNSFVVSSQVVQEFCNGALKKFQQKIPANELIEFLNTILLPNCNHYPNPDFYTSALRLYQTNSLSYYDSLIIQGAIESGCNILFSEDLADAQKFGPVTIRNPFIR